MIHFKREAGNSANMGNVRGGSTWILDYLFMWKPIPLGRDAVLGSVRDWEGALSLPGPGHVRGTVFTGWKQREFEADIESRPWSIEGRDYQARFLILVGMLGLARSYSRHPQSYHLNGHIRCKALKIWQDFEGTAPGLRRWRPRRLKWLPLWTSHTRQGLTLLQTV